MEEGYDFKKMYLELTSALQVIYNHNCNVIVNGLEKVTVFDCNKNKNHHMVIENGNFTKALIQAANEIEPNPAD